MIGVQGQYIFKFDLVGFEDFISEDNFTSFTIHEEAGNYLPTFNLVFIMQNDDMFHLLHEGNDIKVSFGRVKDEMFDCKLVIAKSTSMPSATGKRVVSCSGFYSALEYLNTTNVVITEQVGSIALLRERVSKYFKPEFNVFSSSDSMRWICPNWTEKKFISEVWLHAYLKDSFPAVGITCDGRFVLKDIKLDLQLKPEWNIVKNIENTDKDLTYNNDALMQTNSGFMNNLFGYGRSQVLLNCEEGTESLLEAKPSPMVAMTSKLMQRTTTSRHYGNAFVNDNVHENYSKAFLQNMTYLFAFSSVTIQLSYSNRFYPMRVLDKISFKDDDVSKLHSVSSEFNSGVYFINKITRTIAKRQLNTTLEICRESINQVR